MPYEPKDAEYLKSYPGTATYEEIKEWILTKYNVKVSSLYVAQVKAKDSNLNDIMEATIKNVDSGASPEKAAMPDEAWNTNHFIYKLGPAIVPSKEVKTGNIYPNGRVWAMLDTLLTSDTISEARDISKHR